MQVIRRTWLLDWLLSTSALAVWSALVRRNVRVVSRLWVLCRRQVVISPTRSHRLLCRLCRSSGVWTRSLLSANISRRSTGTLVTRTMRRLSNDTMKRNIRNFCLSRLRSVRSCSRRMTSYRLYSWSAAKVFPRPTSLLFALPRSPNRISCNKTASQTMISSARSGRQCGSSRTSSPSTRWVSRRSRAAQPITRSLTTLSPKR
mmetsp:Transcript_2189/g.5175  ORF Transcript_2189/g.5175 Transcript_2189/m.5175 type:complete len:203 (+) Transcript_2189:1363-1971(+)